MATKKVIGFNWLNDHPAIEARLGLDNAHVIVDRQDWEQAKQLIQNNVSNSVIDNMFGDNEIKCTCQGFKPNRNCPKHYPKI